MSAPDTRFLDRSTPPHIATLILLSGVSALTMNIFLPSLPRMVEYFDTEYRLVQLSVAIYLGVNAVLQIFVGPVSDKFGRRPVILGGIGIFCVATVGCIFATDIYVFLIFRMIQAAIVTAMVLSRAVVRDMVPQDKAASMIGYVTMGMAVVPMIGPAIGGVLDQVFGWQSNFWLLLLCGLALFWLTWRDLGETARPSGLTLSQQFREYPELLRSPRFWGYAMAAGMSSGAFFAYLGGAPFVGSEVFGLSPALLGIFFGAPAVGYFLGNYASGRFSTDFGVNRMVLVGTIINGAGIAASMVVFLIGAGSALSFFGFMCFVGLGNGMTIPNATAGALSVRPHLAGTASGLAGAIMIGFGAALSAAAGALLQPGTGAWPLLWLQLGTAILGVFSILVVIRRERQISRLDPA
ncbi:MFS transporter, DHA1 family, bicyclomycin/chloramphenicol resistance protein [Roseivivax halotolerans]|jgi:DHA1 family bicyclomycin/chloramphenicol resistance-like MFS transporter|uniref:Bcr/CflA family efflux transporter n=1 Tax=Roseivivax halotolerans TaxID=93684 RepID=A0A1I5X821_9RHOB|nr:multidrug effflux MFS transporter [Roseivivax halotolerans]SFQ27807.1 MFS transporter, DHA1 family, bicyclomycin/chloramphenicol resistance protein [Roseivivax halotolerans]